MAVRKLFSSILKKYIKIKKKLLERRFSSMNENQQKAVFNVNGPVIVLAGAGSGKTTAIINRIVNMVDYGDAYTYEESDGEITEEKLNILENAYNSGAGAESVKTIISRNAVAPWNILAITFTNKAAGELKERLSLALGSRGEKVWASTFHSLCSRILRIDADKLGYSNHFVVYDEDDTKRLVKECMRSLNIDDKVLSYKSVKCAISNAKNKLIDHNEYRKDSANDFRLTEIANVYDLYQKKLVESDAMDFDDLIMNVVKLFERYPEILQKYQDQFKYILVDEYQDTNFVQFVLVQSLARKSGNICVVGDDDQSIYKFRGATIENILNFEKNFPGAKTIRLEQNYRSTQTILDAANAVIKNNSNRKGKMLWTKNEKGENIKVHTAYSEHDEAQYIAEAIQDMVAKGAKYSDIAILYRLNVQSNALEKVLIRSAIPYRTLGGVRFYERKEIRDMIAYLSVVNNPCDEVHLKRIINQPRRSIGERTITQATEISQKMGMTLLDVIKNSNQFEQLRRVSSKLTSFSNLICDLIEYSRDPYIRLHDLYSVLVEKTGYLKFLKEDKENGEARIENVREFLTNIRKYEENHPDDATLAGFLEEVSLFSDIDNYDQNSDSVVMMTLHSAKGLEFPVVFIPGFEEGVFPGAQFDLNDEAIEEERRLAYVGITRARRKLYILNSDSRMIFGSTSHNKCSRFLNEIPDELLDKTKSKDWKNLKKGEDVPKSAQEIRAKSALSAHHFGQISGGKATSGVPLSTKFVCGDKVLHKKFGQGEVLAAVPTSGDTYLEISFKCGTKRLLANFANLEKI